VAEEQLAGGRGQAPGGEAGLVRQVLLGLGEQVVDEQAQVALAVAQRREAQDGDGEAKEQVLAEAAGGDLGEEVAVGGRDDADVDLARGGFAHAGDIVLLQGAQELDLGGEGQLAELVEEERAAVGGLEDAGALGEGAGEGSFGVPEEGGLDQLGRDGAAVDRDEGAAAPGAGGVDGPGEQLLAGAGLALEQDRDGPRGDMAGAAEEAGHRLAAVDDGGELGDLGRQGGAVALERGVRAAQEVGDQLGGELEGDRRGLDPVLAGGLDQLGRIAGLAEDQPDGGHGRRAGAQVKGQPGAGAASERVDHGDGGGVDLTPGGGAGECHLVEVDVGLGPGAQPGEVVGAFLRPGVREQVDALEAAGGDGLADRADADLLGPGHALRSVRPSQATRFGPCGRGIRNFVAGQGYL
jgi:hypothetical protein